MQSVVSFGEILLRLKTPGHERFFQSNMLESTFGGSEANVISALAQFGQKVSFVTVVPDNAVGDAVVSELRKYNVNTAYIKRRPGRLGIYFLETGSYQRPSNVIYDRKDSCVAHASSGEYNWPDIFKGAGWFHISGIMPAISEDVCDTCIEALKAAKDAGLVVSLDINYRRKLWNDDRKAASVMKEMMKYVDVLIANEEHIRFCLDITVPGYDTSQEGLPDEYFKKLSENVKNTYPSVSVVALTRRRTYTSDTNDFSAVLYNDGGGFFVSRKYHLENIVDRVGGGDAFSAGLIYGLLNYSDKKEALEFAAAAACLKHTIPGDIAILSKEEVEQLVKSSSSNRIQR
jgi:2-dehydro-3-deoxygluconokinase